MAVPYSRTCKDIFTSDANQRNQQRPDNHPIASPPAATTSHDNTSQHPNSERVLNLQSRREDDMTNLEQFRTLLHNQPFNPAELTREDRLALLALFEQTIPE
jgi:hypothetical protein